MRTNLMAACVWATSLLGLSHAQAETPFTILAGEPAFMAEAQLIAKSITHENGLRVLPMLGEGSVTAIADMQAIPAVDAVLVTADAAAYAKAQGVGGNVALAAIAALKPVPVVLVTRRGISNVTALAGKRIATGPVGTASFAAGELILTGLEMPFVSVATAQEDAVEALAAGKADAALFVGLPANLNKLGPAYHSLALTLPPGLSQTYKPARFTAQDLPGLLAANEQADGLTTELVLAVSPTPAGAHTSLKAFEQEFFRQTADNPAILKQDVPGLPREANAATLIKQLSPNATIQPAGATP